MKISQWICAIFLCSTTFAFLVAFFWMLAKVSEFAKTIPEPQLTRIVTTLPNGEIKVGYMTTTIFTNGWFACVANVNGNQNYFVGKIEPFKP